MCFGNIVIKYSLKKLAYISNKGLPTQLENQKLMIIVWISNFPQYLKLSLFLASVLFKKKTDKCLNY